MVTVPLDLLGGKKYKFAILVSSYNKVLTKNLDCTDLSYSSNANPTGNKKPQLLQRQLPVGFLVSAAQNEKKERKKKEKKPPCVQNLY